VATNDDERILATFTTDQEDACVDEETPLTGGNPRPGTNNAGCCFYEATSSWLACSDKEVRTWGIRAYSFLFVYYALSQKIVPAVLSLAALLYLIHADYKSEEATFNESQDEFVGAVPPHYLG